MWRWAIIVGLAAVSTSCSHNGRKTGAETASVDAGGWKTTFPVDRGRLGPTGGNTYFDLRPGAVRTYQEGTTRLTITTLDQTRVVDGVTTRVVEEREEKNGQPEEVSRNYFAADRVSGDVYYFGEDVDIYKGGRVVEHPGVWRSGEAGARFGLFVPARPALGEKFYQEVAPGTAMDRVEIVGLDETVETPAGRFEHCLHAKETTPLEPDVGHKWFAPGIGLVKDGAAALVERR